MKKYIIMGLFLFIFVPTIFYGGFRLGITGAVKEDMKKLDDMIKKEEQKAVSSSPSELKATVKSISQIDLEWKDNSYKEDGFKIERKVQNESYSQIDAVGEDVTSYSDTGLIADTIYYYRIRAYKGSTNSSYCDEVYTKTRAGEYNSPGTNPSGLTWDGYNIWSCDSTTSFSIGKIYKHNMDKSLSVSATYNSPSREPAGLAWDGSNLWSCDYNGRIYRHNMDATLSVANTYVFSDGRYGLTWDGTNIWSSCILSNIHKHNMDANLSISNSYASPLNSSTGLAWDGNNLYSIDEANSIIYKHNMDATLSVVSTYEFSPSGLTSPAGLTWDGTCFWSCDQWTNKIYKH